MGKNLDGRGYEGRCENSWGTNSDSDMPLIRINSGMPLYTIFFVIFKFSKLRFFGYNGLPCYAVNRVVLL